MRRVLRDVHKGSRFPSRANGAWLLVDRFPRCMSTFIVRHEGLFLINLVEAEPERYGAEG